MADASSVLQVPIASVAPERPRPWGHSIGSWLLFQPLWEALLSDEMLAATDYVRHLSLITAVGF